MIQDRETCCIVGINVPRLYSVIVGLGGALAVLTGIFLGSRGLMNPTMGSAFLTKALLIIVVGTLGDIRGTMIASFIIAEIESIAGLFIPIFWVNPLLFLLMMIVIVVKPSGLFGRSRREV